MVFGSRRSKCLCHFENKVADEYLQLVNSAANESRKMYIF